MAYLEQKITLGVLTVGRTIGFYFVYFSFSLFGPFSFLLTLLLSILAADEERVCWEAIKENARHYITLRACIMSLCRIR